MNTKDGKFARTPPSTISPRRAASGTDSSHDSNARGIAADATTAEATEQFGVSM